VNVTEAGGEHRPIPGALNVALLAAVAAADVGALVWASRAATWWSLTAAAIAFSFSNNTVFALLHEAVHGTFHRSSAVNRWAGRFAAAFFPTGFAVQRAFHVTHHRHNRDRFEQFDYVHAGDVRWLKFAQWYAILTGVYWLVTVAGVAVHAVLPRALRVAFLRSADSRAAEQTASRPYLDALDDLPPVVPRLEVAAAFTAQALLCAAFGISAVAWVSCYAAFALNWSSLQYADHAFSPLDNVEGAWNLRVPRPVRWLFLNYHYHLAHHRSPQTSWIHLGKLVRPGDPSPTFLGIWLAMWRGPRPFPGAQPPSAPTTPSA
jgi:fatty acid desaturase